MRRFHICPWCQQKFRFHPRLGLRQKSCGQPACKRKQALLKLSEWKIRHHDLYQIGQKDWRQAHPDYWKNYRHNHPDYVLKNRCQTRSRKALLMNRGLQKKIDIAEASKKQTLFWSAWQFAKEYRSFLFAPCDKLFASNLPSFERPP